MHRSTSCATDYRFVKKNVPIRRVSFCGNIISPSFVKLCDHFTNIYQEMSKSRCIHNSLAWKSGVIQIYIIITLFYKYFTHLIIFFLKNMKQKQSIVNAADSLNLKGQIKVDFSLQIHRPNATQVVLPRIRQEKQPHNHPPTPRLFTTFA